MRKALALVLVIMLVLGSTVAFAASTSAATKDTTQTDNVRTFFSDFATLFRKQIPETLDHPTNNNLFDKTSTQKN